MQHVTTVHVQQDLDPYFDLRALSKYSSLSISTLKGFLGDPEHPLPVFQPAGKGGKVLVRKSEFDRWMDRHHRVQAADVSKTVDDVLAKFRRA